MAPRWAEPRTVDPVEQVDKLIDTDTGTGEPGVAIVSDDPTVESWEYRGGLLKMSACSEIVDLRVRFVATAIVLNSNSAAQALGLTNVYVYKTCEKIMTSRSGAESAVTFEKWYERSCADFEALSVKTQHGKRMRLGGRRSASPTGWPGGFMPPIVDN